MQRAAAVASAAGTARAAAQVGEPEVMADSVARQAAAASSAARLVGAESSAAAAAPAARPWEWPVDKAAAAKGVA